MYKSVLNVDWFSVVHADFIEHEVGSNTLDQELSNQLLLRLCCDTTASDATMNYQVSEFATSNDVAAMIQSAGE